jgi:hypothetical protein
MLIDLSIWMAEVEANARRSQNNVILKALALYHGAWKYFETDPDQVMTRLTTASGLALQQHEYCLANYFDYWISEIFLYYKIDIAQGLDRSVKTAAEIRKSAFADCPCQGRIIRQLIDAYLEYDPVGYEKETSEALTYLENEVPLDEDTWRAIPEQQASLMIALGRSEDAWKWALVGLDRSSASDFRMMHVYRKLCDIAYMRGQDDDIMKFALLGEGHAQHTQNSIRVQAAMALWQAYCHRKRGELEMATRRHAHAMQILHRQKASLVERYYDPLCAYLEADGQIDLAVEARARETEAAGAAHSPYREGEAHLQHCRLLKLSGRLDEASLATAQAVATRMRAPQIYLDRLAKIVGGSAAERD